jgi:multicomponent Na+:H+ antiporter subunit G
MLLQIASTLCLGAGAFFVLVGCVGLLRMPDLYTRMHAAGVADTLGAGLLLLGMLLTAGPTLVGAKLVMLGLLIFFASPTACHALARAALVRGTVAIDDQPEKRPSIP